jgi:hypothetical protein
MVKKVNYLNIQHDLVPTHFKGNPKFINYFPINNKPVAVYENTDKLVKKLYKYKKYMLLFKQDDKFMVGGLSKVKKEVTAVKCKYCDDVIYSCYRHDYNQCSCESTFIDGGTDYCRTNSKVIGTLNLLTDTFKEHKIGKKSKSKSVGTRISPRGTKKTKKRNQKVETRKPKSKS